MFIILKYWKTQNLNISYKKNIIDTPLSNITARSLQIDIDKFNDCFEEIFPIIRCVKRVGQLRNILEVMC